MGRFLALANSTLASLPLGEGSSSHQGLTGNGKWERDGVRGWVSNSMGTSAVASPEKKK